MKNIFFSFFACSCLPFPSSSSFSISYRFRLAFSLPALIDWWVFVGFTLFPRLQLCACRLFYLRAISSVCVKSKFSGRTNFGRQTKPNASFSALDSPVRLTRICRAWAAKLASLVLSTRCVQLWRSLPCKCAHPGLSFPSLYMAVYWKKEVCLPFLSLVPRPTSFACVHSLYFRIFMQVTTLVESHSTTTTILRV